MNVGLEITDRETNPRTRRPRAGALLSGKIFTVVLAQAGTSKKSVNMVAFFNGKGVPTRARTTDMPARFGIIDFKSGIRHDARLEGKTRLGQNAT